MLWEEKGRVLAFLSFICDVMDLGHRKGVGRFGKRRRTILYHRIVLRLMHNQRFFCDSDTAILSSLRVKHVVLSSFL
jgi:hypothetical protein